MELSSKAWAQFNPSATIMVRKEGGKEGERVRG